MARCQYPQKSTLGFALRANAATPTHLGAIVSPAVILAPRALLSVAGQVDARDVVVMTSLGATHPARRSSLRRSCTRRP